MRLDVKPVSIIPIVEAAVDAVRPAADAKNIQLQVIIDSAANIIRADQARLQQVIWNLLSNSIKFTPARGFVEIKISRTPLMVEITVSDNGDGISKEFLPYVFERFQQADASATRKHGGLGLGLAITRNLVEMHGGTIEAESDGLGHGARFRIKLPTPSVNVQPSDKAANEAGPSLLQPDGFPNLSGLRILAVDDSSDTREFVRTALETCGANVATVSSVSEALDVLAGWRSDLLICDIGMPEQDGYTLLKKIRELAPEEGGNIPAIALTGYVRVEDRMRALEAGYQMFVPKPIEAGELCAVVATLVRRIDQS